MGDGAQASQLPLPVPALGSAAVARLSKPINWFTIITQGKIERMMPPFKSLTDRQRWDLVAYLYTLSAPQQVVAAGKTVYEANCQSCHGVKGAGDGEKASSLSAKVPNWRDLTRLAQLSARDMVTVVNNGAGQVMPAFASQLSDEQRWAAVEYIRSLTFAGNASPSSAVPTTSPTSSTSVTPGAATPVVSSTPAGTASAPLTKVTFTGKVTHSGAKPIPGGLKVTLQGFDNMTPAWEATADVQADSTYKFQDVELVTGRVFVATLVYQKVEFTSATIHSSDLGGSPRIDRHTLYEHQEGLIVLTACLKGEIPWRLTHNDPTGARARALELQKVFGDRLYLEIQENGIPEQTIANQGLMALAEELGIKLVATNDCHYLGKEESYAHEVLLSIQTGKTINDPNRFRFNTDQLYFKSGDEMAAQFLLPSGPEQHPGSGRAMRSATGIRG